MHPEDEVKAHIENDLPAQIRALARQRGWTQQELARRSGMKQSTISALMKPGGDTRNLRTLMRLARAFDCGLLVVFVPSEQLIDWRRSFNPENFVV